MSFEPPRKGNPFQFVIQQHFHTAHSIEKFCDDDDQVEVHFLDSGKTEKRHKRAKVFCTKRNWDQKAEIGLMAEIEEDFHNEIDNIKPYASRNHQAISKYFLLWRIRHNFHISPIDDAILTGISGSGLTKVQEEILESKGAIYVREGGAVPARFITGIQVLMQLDKQWPRVENFKWGLLTANEGEFIVADCYKDLTFMPVSPTLVFCAGYKDLTINKESVANANRQSIEKASEFYFARKMADCPVA